MLPIPTPVMGVHWTKNPIFPAALSKVVIVGVVLRGTQALPLHVPHMQSTSTLQATHTVLPVLHTALVGQSELAVHCMQVFVDNWHFFKFPEQLLSFAHCTHNPD